MIVINLSHPFTPAHLARIEALTQMKIARVIEQLPQFDHVRGFAEQVREIVNALGLSSAEWQSAPILLNPPGLAPGALAVIAEMHGRMGHFPAIVRMRPLMGSTPTQYEIAEIVNLQTLREQARLSR